MRVPEVMVDRAVGRQFFIGKVTAKTPGVAPESISDATLLADMKMNSLKAMVIISSLKEIAPVNYDRAIGRSRVMRSFGDMLHNACVLCELDG